MFSQVGQVDGDEVIAPTSDALPRDTQQGAAVPDLVKNAVSTAFLDQHDIAVRLVVVGAGPVWVDSAMSLSTSPLMTG